jgi:hypothetical protein
MRTPSAAEQITRVANAALKTVAGEFFSDSRAVADLYRERVNGDETGEAIDQFRKLGPGWPDARAAAQVRAAVSVAKV